RKGGGEATFVKADLSNAAEREQLVKDATTVYGAPDILVNNGAVTFYYPIEQFPEKRFKLMIEVQVWAALHLSQLVLPAMRERKPGAIITIASGAAQHPKLPYDNNQPGGTVSGMGQSALGRFP